MNEQAETLTTNDRDHCRYFARQKIEEKNYMHTIYPSNNNDLEPFETCHDYVQNTFKFVTFRAEVKGAKAKRTRKKTFILNLLKLALKPTLSVTNTKQLVWLWLFDDDDDCGHCWGHIPCTSASRVRRELFGILTGFYFDAVKKRISKNSSMYTLFFVHRI